MNRLSFSNGRRMQMAYGVTEPRDLAQALGRNIHRADEP